MIKKINDPLEKIDFDKKIDENYIFYLYIFCAFVSWLICSIHFPRILFGYTLYSIYVSGFIDVALKILPGIIVAKITFWLIGTPVNFVEVAEDEEAGI